MQTIRIETINLEYLTTSSTSVAPTGGMVIATVDGRRIMFEIAPQLALLLVALVCNSAPAESEPPR